MTTATHQRMQQLEWVGEQYVQAIAGYYEGTPGRNKSFPRTLNDLLEDKRFVVVRRHLRAPYVNPLTGTLDFELVLAPDGGIRGIRAQVQRGDRSEVAQRDFVYSPVIR